MLCPTLLSNQTPHIDTYFSFAFVQFMGFDVDCEYWWMKFDGETGFLHPMLCSSSQSRMGLNISIA